MKDCKVIAITGSINNISQILFAGLDLIRVSPFG
jgi:hypothetical protein